MTTDFDAKANAVVSCLLEAYQGADSVDLINFVLSDIDLTDDGLELVKALSELVVTTVVLFADTMGVDPLDLWIEFMLNS